MSSLPHPDDTIAALASAAGGAARGIVRVSGPRVVETLRDWFSPAPSDLAPMGRPASSVFETRIPSCIAGSLKVAGVGRAVPVDLFLWPGRRSYTGEPLAEIHTIGSPPLLEAILAELHVCGIRAAQPGEFTLRAFLAGRLDLMQAEAVLGVIDARDRSELQNALEQLGGGVSSHVVRLRGDLLDLLADLEAGLDFAEEDIEFVSHATLVGRIGLAHEAVADLINRASARLSSQTSPRVVLTGPPNAGKSTLFNALVGGNPAIVSDERGTTRDYLSGEVSARGVTFTLVDTAGSEASADPIGIAAQQLRREQVSSANLIVLCHAADSADELSPSISSSAGLSIPTDRLLVALTKSDLHTTDFNTTNDGSVAPFAIHPVSAQTGAGLRDLTHAITSRLADRTADPHGLLGTTAARCRDSLLGASQALERALEIARVDVDPELLAVELRETLDELGKIVGAVYTDDILDRIFSKFCIGK